MTWSAILLAGVGCYLLKLAGLMVPANFFEGPRAAQVLAAMPVALLAALVVVQVFGGGSWGIAVDARLIALAVAALALAFRAPFLVVVLVAALTAALLRMAGLP